MTDKTCEYAKFLDSDIIRMLAGDYYCTAPSRDKEKDEFGQDADFFSCDSGDCLQCNFYLSEKSKLGKII